MKAFQNIHKLGIVVFGLILLPALLAPAFPALLPYFTRPQLIYFYATQPAMRDLMNLIAEDRLNAFATIWDTSEGVLLSKKIYRPVVMDGEVRFSHQPNSSVLFFQTGTAAFQRKFVALDTLRLRGILDKLDTRLRVKASFDAYGFRHTGYDYNETCTDTVMVAGDSFTEGLWVEDRETFVSLLAQSLNQTGGRRTCVVNAGTNGYGIFEESAIARKYFEKIRFHTLYLIHYPNDVAPDAFAVLRGDLPDLEARWDEHFKHLIRLAAFTTENKIRMVLVPIPPKEQFAMPEGVNHYQERLRAFAQSHGIHFWDPFEKFLGYSWEDLYLDWDPHLNASGHRILAAFLWEKSLTLPQPEL